jgi:hypothetical protein
MGLSDESALRNALGEDELFISNLLGRILESEVDRKVVLLLPREDARRFLDLFEWVHSHFFLSCDMTVNISTV